MKVYHRTTKENFEKIKKEGLKINQKNEITTDTGIFNLKIAYGMIPIFVALNPNVFPITNDNQIMLEIDFDFDMKYAADIGVLIDNGAILDEEGFYFNDSSDAYNEYNFTDDLYEYSETLYFDPYKDAFIEFTQTIAILEDIPVEKIKF